MAANRCHRCAHEGRRPDYGRYPEPETGDVCDGCGARYLADEVTTHDMGGFGTFESQGRWRPPTAVEVMGDALKEALESGHNNDEGP